MRLFAIAPTPACAGRHHSLANAEETDLTGWKDTGHIGMDTATGDVDLRGAQRPAGVQLAADERRLQAISTGCRPSSNGRRVAKLEARPSIPRRCCRRTNRSTGHRHHGKFFHASWASSKADKGPKPDADPATAE